MILYHIVSEKEWQEARPAGIYRPSSLDTDGFIHCCTLQQVPGVGERYYKGVQGLLILSIDTRRLTVECRYEDSHGDGDLFPHLYGPLPVEAVVKESPFSPDPDGLFVQASVLLKG